MRLQELVQHRRLAIAAHARGAHLVDAVPGDPVENREWLDVPGAGGLEHLRGGHRHVGNHRLLVFAPRHRDAQHGDAELVDDLGIERDEVVEPRQHLAESDQVDRGQRIEDGVLERCAVPGRVHAEARRAASLKAEAAQIRLLARPVDRVLHPDRVEPVRTPRRAERRLGRGRVRKLSARAAGDPRVIHQVVPEHAARVGEASLR